jgi:hypothetical protein
MTKVKDAEVEVATPSKVAVVEKPKKEQVVEITAYEKQRTSVESMIAQAIEKGMPVETMKEILAMRKELKADWAKEQFDRAMADCQAAMPVIAKSKQARDETKGKDLYKYAPLDAIVAIAGPIIAQYGFSYSFKTLNTPTLVKVTCIVKHRDGHSEESDMETTLATKTQIMSAPQQIAATVTFNKRYAFTNAFGIITGGEDDESQLPKDAVPQIEAPAIGTVRAMIKDAKLQEGVLAQKFNVATIDELNPHQLKILEKSLLAKLGPDYIPTIQQ